jgi:hypothetical protein
MGGRMKSSIGFSYQGKQMKQKETKALQEYLSYVSLAKGLLSEIKSHQAKIAFYATKVCEIKHGGRTASSVYTISKFAEDIGMNRKTLSEWISIYKNVIVKLGKEASEVSGKDWQAARRVQNIINEQLRTDQALAGVAGKKERGSRKNASPEVIKDMFNQNYNGPSFQKEFHDWNDYMITIKNKVRSRDLSQISVSSLISMKETADALSEHILKQLTRKEPSTSTGQNLGRSTAMAAL